MKTLKTYLANAALLFAALIISLLVTEGALRHIDYQYTPLRIERINTWSEWRYFFASSENDNFVYDPALIWRPRKGSEWFNEQGYRGRLLTAIKQRGDVRIFAIGDSNTLGVSGKNGPQWPAYLEQLLNENGRNATVTNAGVYGYTSFQGLRRFKESLGYEPDLVLISFGCNDAMHVTMSDAEFAGRKLRNNNWDQVLTQTRIGQLILNALDSLPGDAKERLVPRVTLEEYKANLSEIIRVAATQRIKVVLLTRPFTGTSASPWWWKNFAPQYNAATLETAERTGVLAIDVYSFFKDCPDCFLDESHLTETGMREMAKLVYEKIQQDVQPTTVDLGSRAPQ
jgi:lysophospholipase L1-like esterase